MIRVFGDVLKVSIPLEQEMDKVIKTYRDLLPDSRSGVFGGNIFKNCRLVNTFDGVLDDISKEFYTTVHPVLDYEKIPHENFLREFLYYTDQDMPELIARFIAINTIPDIETNPSVLKSALNIWKLDYLDGDLCFKTVLATDDIKEYDQCLKTLTSDSSYYMGKVIDGKYQHLSLDPTKEPTIFTMKGEVCLTKRSS